MEVDLGSRRFVVHWAAPSQALLGVVTATSAVVAEGYQSDVKWPVKVSIQMNTHPLGRRSRTRFTLVAAGSRQP